MVGALFALVICAWIYQTAEKLRLPPIPWIIGALLVFYLSSYGWTYLVLKPLLGAKMKAHGAVAGFLIEFSGALVGTALAAVFRSRVLLKQQSGE